jgi:general secretion pathway protein G
MKRERAGFTMIELVFVIVVIGILSAIAIPKFAATRDDAIISKARSTVASIRTGLATYRQKNILKGDYSAITSIDSNILEYGLRECESSSEKNCWEEDNSSSPTKYTFRMPDGTSVEFKLENNRFECSDPSQEGCKLLTR